jgi:signal transduction histidine kinase
LNQVKKRPKILVVDDDDLVLESLKSELGGNYQVLTASLASEALTIFDQEQVDCVISDVRMPGVNGITLLREVGARDPFVGRILITAYTDSEATDAAIHEKGVYKVAKPWRDELEIAIRRTIELRATKLKLEQSLQHLNRSAELERQLKSLTDPYAIMEQALTFIARIDSVQSVDISFKHGDVFHRLAVATRDRVLFEQNTAIPDQLHISQHEFKLERSNRGWLYALPLWEADEKHWQLRCFLARLCQEDLAWIDFVAEQMVDAMDHTVLVQEVNRHRQNSNPGAGQLFTMEKMASIGMLAAGVAHEINNPAAYVRANLSVMESYLKDFDNAIARFEDLLEKSGRHELLDDWRRIKEEEKLTNSRNEMFEMLQETNEGMDRIINISMNLKSFTFIGSAQRERVEIHRCLDMSLSMIMFRYKSGVSVNRFYDDVPDVYGNSSELGQVFLNILINAAQAMDGKGNITIHIDFQNRWVRVRIQDSGPGILSEHILHIFEPLFTTKISGEGTGLGLSISKEIIERHGGKIDVDSTPGHGAVFTICLPPLEDYSG